MANPPVGAQELLARLLRADARDAVAGDLLEEYREARLPALGEWRANFWYWRQVGSLWLRAYWWFLAAAILLGVLHDIFNTFRAPSGASYLDALPALARLPLSPLMGLCVMGLAGAYGSLRTQRFGGGVVAALGTFVGFWAFAVLWSNLTFYPFAQVQRSNPYWIQAWQWSTQHERPRLGADPTGDTFLHWIYWDNVGGLFFFGLAGLTISAICGSIGSALGIITARRRPAASHELSDH